MDVVVTEVMRNRFAAMAAEASYIAYRAAHTTFVKQTQDYQVAMASLSGEFFAFPTQSGVTSGVCQNIRGIIDEIGLEELGDGDIIITNDPFSGGSICTHTMDIHLIKPVYYHGELIAFAWAFIHASDIGGSVPGSVDPNNYEVYQEGIRITPSLLYKGGELNSQLWRMFEDNSRIPELIWGDLQAMISGLNLLQIRAFELCDRYGKRTFLEGIENILSIAENKSKEILSSLKDGSYRFSDYLEAYRGEEPIFISAEMKVNGGQVSIDFDGSDPQVQFSMNFPSSGYHSHPMLCLALIDYVQTVAPTVPVNGGLIRPVRASAPSGTIMNATFPAAGGNRGVTINRIYDVILGCLNQAIEGGISAAGSGMAGIISASYRDPQSGRRLVSVVEPFIGGGGARRDRDGVDGINNPTAYLRTAPVEAVEAETSLLFKRFSLAVDSGGAGQFRGGRSLQIEFENRSVSTIVAVRGLDRFRFNPWGIAGGACGRRGESILNPGTPRERKISKVDLLEMKRGDVLLLTTPSGAGFGHPYARTAESVLEDVIAGVVSPEAARTVYGVAITGSAIDASETKALRSASTSSEQLFSFGGERGQLEKLWPSVIRAHLAKKIMQTPQGLRSHLLTPLLGRLNDTGCPVTSNSIDTEIRELLPN